MGIYAGRDGNSTSQSERTIFCKVDFAHRGTTVSLDCQLDTGATCNVISRWDVCTIQLNSNPVLTSANIKLKLYDGTLVTTLGEYKAQCSYGGSTYSLDFKVIWGNQQPLLSGRTCQALGMLTINVVNAAQSTDLIDQYNDVFEGLGCLKGSYHTFACEFIIQYQGDTI